MSIKKKSVSLAVYSFLSFLALLQIVPILWLISFSFKTNGEIYTKNAFSLPENFLIENYQNAWSKGSVAQYFSNSLIVTFSSVLLTLLFSCMVAYAVSRMKWKLQNHTLIFFMLGMMIPIHATLVPLFIILQKMNLLSTSFSIILPYIATSMPLGVFIFANFMRTLPYELEQAAYIDGCGVFRSFFHIILPSLKSAFATIAIFTFMNTWNEFIMASTFIQSNSLKTLPLGLMAFKGMYSVEWGPLGAAIVIASIPLIFIYFVFSDQIEKSFAAGAILK